jgi:alginate O-acetyltransferase complex protein AlgI
MLFNSIHFVFFLPVVIVLYYLIPHRFRWLMLLLASYYFLYGMES